MRFILSFDNGYSEYTLSEGQTANDYVSNEKLMVFPIVENGSIDYSVPQDSQTFDTVNGQMAAIGRVQLSSFSISSFFPNKAYPFIAKGAKADGWWYVEKIKAVRAKRLPFRATLFDDNGKIVFNIPAIITNFTYGIDRAKDIAYTIDFQEYRFGTILTTADLVTSKNLTEAEATASIANTETETEASTSSGTAPALSTLGTPSQLAYNTTDLNTMTNVLYGEANGSPTVEVAAVAWTICNRCDKGKAGGFRDSITAVITQPGQFEGYKATANASHTEYKWVAEDVLTRWSWEKLGKADVGRIMPSDYLYFNGYNGHNWFSKVWRSSPYQYYANAHWTYTLPSPYSTT